MSGLEGSIVGPKRSRRKRLITVNRSNCKGSTSMRDTQAAVKRGVFVLFEWSICCPWSFVMRGADGDVTKWGCVPSQMLL